LSAKYRGETVRVYRTKRNRSQIAYQGMLRWVKTSELEVL